jgi:hypothetical protein
MAKAEKGFKVKKDNSMNPELKKEIQGLRGLIWNNMPALHSRFEMAQHPERPAVYIQDTKTGRISEPIGLCDLRGAIEALNWISASLKP